MSGAENALHEVIARVPVLRDAAALEIADLPGGLTNTNYLVTADGSGFVVRVAGANGAVVGIDREREHSVLERAVAAGIAPNVEAFLLPEGHSVTRYLDAARSPSLDEFTTPSMIRRIAYRLRDIHSLAPIEGVFDPYGDIRRWLEIIDARGTRRPERLVPLLAAVAATEAERRGAGATGSTLCHNDPYYRNFLDDGSLWVIDWEYAGMSDPFYDLAGVAYTLDDAGKDVLLHAYFGRVEWEHREQLDRMIAVFLCWNAAWSLLHVGMSAIDFDYGGFAEELIDLVPRLD